jgi:hypothetical protein
MTCGKRSAYASSFAEGHEFEKPKDKRGWLVFSRPLPSLSAATAPLPAIPSLDKRL